MKNICENVSVFYRQYSLMQSAKLSDVLAQEVIAHSCFYHNKMDDFLKVHILQYL